MSKYFNFVKISNIYYKMYFRLKTYHTTTTKSKELNF